MTASARVMGAVGLVLVFAGSAVFAAEQKFSGFFGNPAAYDLMRPGPEGGVKLRWLKEGVDPKKYNRFMVDSVVFFLAHEADYKGIDPQEMKELADAFNRELAVAFKDKWPIVADPGSDVARIRIAITNIKPSRPGVSAVTSVVPVALGVSLVKKGATGGWTGSGDTCMEVMALDSTTDEIILLAFDEQKAAFEQRFSKWGSANDAFKLWSEKCVAFIDRYKGVRREPEK